MSGIRVREKRQAQGGGPGAYSKGCGGRGGEGRGRAQRAARQSRFSCWVRHGSRIRFREMRQAQGGPDGAARRAGASHRLPDVEVPRRVLLRPRPLLPPAPPSPPVPPVRYRGGLACASPLTLSSSRCARVTGSWSHRQCRTWRRTECTILDSKCWFRISSHLNRPGYLAHLVDIDYIYATLKAKLPSRTSLSRMD